jgi:hypothetical protein
MLSPGFERQHYAAHWSSLRFEGSCPANGCLYAGCNVKPVVMSKSCRSVSQHHNIIRSAGRAECMPQRVLIFCPTMMAGGCLRTLCAAQHDHLLDALMIQSSTTGLHLDVASRCQARLASKRKGSCEQHSSSRHDSVPRPAKEPPSPTVYLVVQSQRRVLTASLAECSLTADADW